ncbi:unnamed protein product [Amoebophrya sp. A120]|nr:unnamed protein product [Amoebophrya sp. A120]|eukprot:GSA120T00017718001.1
MVRLRTVPLYKFRRAPSGGSVVFPAPARSLRSLSTTAAASKCKFAPPPPPPGGPRNNKNGAASASFMIRNRAAAESGAGSSAASARPVVRQLTPAVAALCSEHDRRTLELLRDEHQDSVLAAIGGMLSCSSSGREVVLASPGDVLSISQAGVEQGQQEPERTGGCTTEKDREVDVVLAKKPQQPIERPKTPAPTLSPDAIGRLSTPVFLHLLERVLDEYDLHGMNNYGAGDAVELQSIPATTQHQHRKAHTLFDLVLTRHRHYFLAQQDFSFSPSTDETGEGSADASLSGVVSRANEAGAGTGHEVVHGATTAKRSCAPSISYPPAPSPDYSINPQFPVENLAASDVIGTFLTKGNNNLTHAALRTERDAYAVLRLLPTTTAVPLVVPFLSESMQTQTLSYSEHLWKGEENLERDLRVVAQHQVRGERTYFLNISDEKEGTTSRTAGKNFENEDEARVAFLTAEYLEGARAVQPREHETRDEMLVKYVKLCVSKANLPFIRAGMVPVLEAFAYFADNLAAPACAPGFPGRSIDGLQANVPNKRLFGNMLKSNDNVNCGPPRSHINAFQARGRAATRLGGQFVGLYSDYVCDHVDALSAADCSRMITALGRRVLPTDEFWMFMLAKRTQETIRTFDGRQIVSVAFSFADQYLEDDDFMKVLVDEVLHDRQEDEPERRVSDHDESIALDVHVPPLEQKKWHALTSVQKVALLWSCAKLRYRDEELAERVLREVGYQDKEWFGHFSPAHLRPEQSGSARTSTSKPTATSASTRLTFYRQFLYALGFLDLLHLPTAVDREFVREVARKARLGVQAKDDEDEWAHTAALSALYLFPSPSCSIGTEERIARTASISKNGSGGGTMPRPTGGNGCVASSSEMLKQEVMAKSPDSDHLATVSGATTAAAKSHAPFFMLLAAALDIISVNRQWTASRRPSLASRRIKLILSCVLNGMLGPLTAFPRSILKQLAQCGSLLDCLNTGGHETDSSGFHLEVATVLDQLRVKYGLEKAASPFVLDLLLSQNQAFFRTEETEEDRRRAAQQLDLERRRLEYVFGVGAAA